MFTIFLALWRRRENYKWHECVIMWILLCFYLNIGKYQSAHFYLSPLILPVYRVIYIQFFVIVSMLWRSIYSLKIGLQFKILVYLFTLFIYFYFLNMLVLNDCICFQYDFVFPCHVSNQMEHNWTCSAYANNP